jgi:predicted peroxiredoxin
MEERKKLLILITRGFDDERSSVAWSIANAGIASDLDVTVFLAASGVDWVRQGAGATARLNPLDPPVGEMIANLTSNGTVLVCPPCAKVRGYSPDDLIEGVTVAGAPTMLEVVKQGAATLSF